MSVLYSRLSTVGRSHSKRKDEKSRRLSTARYRLVVFGTPSVEKIVAEPRIYCKLKLQTPALDEVPRGSAPREYVCFHLLSKEHDRTILSRNPINLLHGYKPSKSLSA
jgi:hypothetical protein